MIKRYVLDDILMVMLRYYGEVSDLNLSVNKPLQVEHDGELKEVPIDPPLALGYLSPNQTEVVALALVDRARRCLRELAETGSCDLGYSLRKAARFRINVFQSCAGFAVVLRRLSTDIPTLDQLKAPKIFKQVVKEKNGLILVTGATGSGKSTTLAAMLRFMNEQKSMHIVTLEDPVEFVHSSIRATFNQREMGADFDTFPSGLRAALRQAPKVILVGEMRDNETMEIGLTAAETGHLVLSTLHTVDAGQTIGRILGMFDKDQEEQIRMRLADTLRWVVCQRLIQKVGGGRIAVHEIMGMNLRVKELIMQGEDEVKTYFSVIESAEPLGWKTFESALYNAFKAGHITESDTIFNSSRRNIIRRKVDFLKSQKGEATTDIKDLQIDKDYVKKARGSAK